MPELKDMVPEVPFFTPGNSTRAFEAMEEMRGEH